MENTSTVMSWFSSPMYSRYWQHYQQAMAWYQRHRRAYRKALEAAYGPGYWQHYQQAMAWYQRRRRAYRKALEAAYGPGYWREHPSSHRRSADWHQEDEEEEEESSSDSEIECDVSNMEISEELREYFAQTEKHREELKKQQQLEAEQQDSYVLADRDLRGPSSRGSVAPPSERPGERRGAEMKKLYGENAPKILAMEAAMQLTFDRNCDLKQPKYWPVIPLKL